MLVRIACTRCRLASLWTDEPRSFLSTVCREPRRCEATLLDEAFRCIPCPAAPAFADDSVLSGLEA